MKANDGADVGDASDRKIKRFLNLHEAAYQSLRKAIIGGAYGPGEKLAILKVSAVLGLSGTPVREAFKRLAAEGALVMLPYRSVHVPELSEAELRELWFIRTTLEGAAAQAAAENAQPAFVDDLAAIELKLEQARREGRIDDINALNAEFHFRLYQESRMPRLCREIERQWLSGAPHIRTFIEHGEEYRPHGQRLHSGILKALRERNAEEVRRLIEADIRLSLDRVLAARQRQQLQQGSRGLPQTGQRRIPQK